MVAKTSLGSYYILQVIVTKRKENHKAVQTAFATDLTSLVC